MSMPAALKAANQCRIAPTAGSGDGIGRHDHAHLDAALRGGDDAADDRVVGEVRVDHVQPAARPSDRLVEGCRDRQVLLAGVVQEQLHRDAITGGRHGEEPIQAIGGRRERSALEVPRQQVYRLQLRDDRAFQAEHHVVELLVGVVVLDPGPADVGHPTVDHDDLAVVEVAEVVEPPVDAPVTDGSVEVQESALVGDDLDTTRNEVPVEVP